MKDAKDKEAAGDFYDAALDRALLGDKDAALAVLERAVAAGQQLDDSMSSNLTQNWTAFAPIRVTPTFCAG